MTAEWNEKIVHRFLTKLQEHFELDPEHAQTVTSVLRDCLIALPPPQPKKKLSGYNLYLQQNLSLYPDLSQNDRVSVIAENWKKISVEERASWNLRASIKREEEPRISSSSCEETT